MEECYNYSIFKYPLMIEGFDTIIKGKFVRPLQVMAQNGIPTIWIQVDERPQAPEVEWKIHCVGTGWGICYNQGYLGSAIDGAGYVWHYFLEEVTRDEYYDCAQNCDEGEW